MNQVPASRYLSRVALFVGAIEVMQLSSSSAKPLPAQRRGKDAKCSSPSHRHVILICSRMDPSWRAIKQRKIVSFGPRKLGLPCCREGRLSASKAGQLWDVQLFCPHIAVCFPSWEQPQPCSQVFWRWNQRITGLHPEKGQKTTASHYLYKFCCWAVTWPLPAGDVSAADGGCLRWQICTFLKDLFFS